MNHRSSSHPTHRTPGALRPLAAALLCLGLGAAVAQTLPQGGVVLGGSVNIPTPTGTQMTINQLTPRGIVQWQDFSIGTGFSVNVVQPSATSVLLNRVTGGQSSAINGALSANGRVFIVNPAGVLFGAGAQVNVGGLVASALSLGTSDAAFMAGTEQFSFAQGGERGLVQNAGQLTAAAGGTIALIGADVFNSGTIAATGGSALLAAGQTVTLDFGGDGLTRVALTAGTDGASRSISQSGTMQADGGRVGVYAAGGSATIEHSGLLQANSLAVRNGQVMLEATASGPRDPQGGGGATILVEGGTVLARGEQAGQTGGGIGILGDQVAMSEGARLDASGAAGGGAISVGTGAAQAGDPLSGAIYLAADAALAADALAEGRGGSMNLRAGRTFRAYGTLSARGAGSGDGGFIVTGNTGDLSAGERNDGVDLRGLRVDAGSAGGLPGSWHIETRNAQIIRGDQPGSTAGSVFEPVAIASQIQDQEINTALVNSNVVVFTHLPGGVNDDGEIFLDNTRIRYEGVGNRVLALSARRSVRSNNGAVIASVGGPLNVTLTADVFNEALNTGGGQVSFSGSIYTNGGAVDMSGRWANASNEGCGVCLNGALVDTRLGNRVAGLGFSGGSDAGAGGGVMLRGFSLAPGETQPPFIYPAQLGAVTVLDSRIATASGGINASGVSVSGEGVWMGGIRGRSDLSTTSGDIQLSGVADNITQMADGSLPRAVDGVRITNADLRAGAGDVNIQGQRVASLSGYSGGTGVTLGNGARIGTTAGGRVDVAASAPFSAGGSTASPALRLDAGSAIDASGAVVLRASAGLPQVDALSVDAQSQVSSQTAINLRPGGVSVTNPNTDTGPTVTAVDAPDQAITVGGTASTGFAVSAAELARMSAPALVLGSDAHAGAITVVGPLARSGDFTLQNPAGNAGIALNGALSADRVGLEAGGDITQAAGAALRTGMLLARSATGSVLLVEPSNQVAALGGSAAARFDFLNAGALSLGAATATGFGAFLNQPQTLTATSTQANAVQVRALAGDLSLSGNVSSNAGADLIAAERLQNAGGYTLGGAPWRVWVRTWEGETRGGLAGSGDLPNLYGCAFPGPCAGNASAADSRFIYAQQPTVTVRADDATRVQGNPNPAFTYRVEGLRAGDSPTAFEGALGSTAGTDSPAGDYAIDGSFVSRAGYNVAVAPGRLTVTERPVIVVEPRLPLFPSLDLVRDRPNSYTLDSNLGLVPICLATGPLAGERSAQAGDTLAREWSRVRSRPNLSNCVDSERRNGCADF